jgi:DNA-binding SARP family transcriptional activator/tetratricopeptide (TPR) repeat protein
VEFRILGPLEVLGDDGPIEVRAAKQRALLAVLLLHANRVVSTDRLIEALWGDRPPGTASKALQVYVSQLRKAIGHERIATRAPGYELAVEPGELDLDRFQELVSEGRPEDALAQWRGPPLGEFAYEPFAQPEIARLEELRIACLEQRVDADLADARHAALVSELEGLVREHPLRERLRAQLMIALYRSGRQAEALETYRAGRRLLADELGLEPGDELKRLQRAILDQDPALAAPEGSSDRLRDPADELLRSPEAPARRVRKVVTVLMLDLTPSAGAVLDPESLRLLREHGLERAGAVLDRYGATSDRSAGGVVTAIFGIPAVREDDALRAVRAAAEIRDALEAAREELQDRWGFWLEVRAGIATGEVVAGATGDDGAFGEPFDRATSLLQATEPWSVLLSPSTLALVTEHVEVEDRGNCALLVSVGAAAGIRSRYLSPMVGRGRELRRIQDAFEQAVGDRSCQLFTILGVAGVGKSRLVRELVDALGDEAVVARGRCLPYGEGITYWPLREIVWELAGLDSDLSAQENLARLESLFEPHESAALAARAVGEVVGLSEGSSAFEETTASVRMLLQTLARRRPFVLVFDDVHWGEETLLDLIDHLAVWIQDAPVLLVCMARPELLDERPHWGGGKLNSTSVLLEPLSEEEAGELVDALAGSGLLDHAQRQRIVEASGGNPLFVEEMLALVLEDGPSSELVLPPTIQALLAARLDRLSSGERAVLEAAAVEGAVFHGQSVALLTGCTQTDLEAHLLSLTRKELIRPERSLFFGRTGYRFRHMLIRDAAYESITKDHRAQLHERHAAWLEQQLGERTLELDEILGYHLEQAYRYRVELGPVGDDERALGRRAAERLGAAGRRALLRRAAGHRVPVSGDATAGVNLISRSVALLSPEDPFRVELVPSVRVVQGVDDLGWADRVLTEAIETAATSGDRGLAARALVQRGFLRLFTGSEVTPAELFEVANRAITALGSLDDELGQARAWRLVAQSHYLDRNGAKCVEASERALEHARRGQDRFEEREIVEWLVISLLFGSTPARAAFARCMELLEDEPGDTLLSTEIASAAATLAAMQGRVAEAHKLIERARAAMSGAGERVWLVSFWYSFIWIWQGDARAAEEELRPAYEALKLVGETSHFSSIAHALSSAVYLQGRYSEAEQLTEECERAAGQNDVFSQILWRSTRAKALARRESFEDAHALALEAVALAATSDFLIAHGDALMDLAEVHLLDGHLDGACDSLEAAARCYEEKGNTLAASRARALLAETRREPADG